MARALSLPTPALSCTTRRLVVAALAAGSPALASAQARTPAELALAGLAVVGVLFLIKTLVDPWFATRQARRAASWPVGLALAFGAVGVAAVIVSAVGPEPGPWHVSAVTWNGLVLATLGLGVAVVTGLALRGRAGSLPRLQQGLALAWIVLVPATTQWDRATRHHHLAPPAVQDVRTSQLRPLTPNEAGPRRIDPRPEAGQCTLQAIRPPDTAPWLAAVYGRGTSPAQERLNSPAAWRDHGATLIGLADGTLGLQDNGGLVRRAGRQWQLDVARPWSWPQVEAAHSAHLTSTARRAELAAREAAWRSADAQLQLIASTPADANAEHPLRLQPESAFERLAAPVPAAALAASGLVCTPTTNTSSGWQCTDQRSAWICPVVHLSTLCEVPGRRVNGAVINLQAGVPPDRTGSDTAWFLFRAQPAACVLLSRRLTDAAARAPSGDGLLTCDPSPGDPTRPVPTLVTHLPFPSDTERGKLSDRVRDLRSARDEASREAPPPPAEPLPFRINAVTADELTCDATAGPCRRFAAELVSDGTAVELTERCSDAATAAAYSRFADPYFKR